MDKNMMHVMLAATDRLLFAGQEHKQWYILCKPNIYVVQFMLCNYVVQLCCAIMLCNLCCQAYTTLTSMFPL